MKSPMRITVGHVYENVVCNTLSCISYRISNVLTVLKRLRVEDINILNGVDLYLLPIV